jgi:hypothetical protein
MGRGTHAKSMKCGKGSESEEQVESERRNNAEAGAEKGRQGQQKPGRDSRERNKESS